MGKLAGVGSRRILSVQAYKVPTLPTVPVPISSHMRQNLAGSGAEMRIYTVGLF